MTTKYPKLGIIVISIIIIVLFLSLAFYVQSRTNDLSLVYGARREDLLAQQQQLEKNISDLNNTLQQMKVREQNLSDQISSLQQKLISGSISSNPSSPGSSGGSVTAVSSPPSPPPAPVTRAS